jgi:amidase
MAASDDIAFLDATAQAELVRRGEASPVELVEGAIARVEKLNPELNAVIHPLFDRAVERASSPALPDGPFRGVPAVVKDLDGMLAGAPLHYGTRYLKRHGYVADHDSYLFQKLQQAGFVIVGKTNTPEFGLNPTTEPLAHGPTRNPWDTSRSTGGSSGGSAAAVSSGMVPVGHAGDGGGSIRIPASECGLVGLKPSKGRVSLGPDEAESWGGCVVRLTVNRSVRDTAAVLDALCGPMPGDPYFAPPPMRPFLAEVGAEVAPLRIGIRTDPFGGDRALRTQPECVAATEGAARLLESMGHTVEPSSPSGLDDPALVTAFTNCFVVWVARDVENMVAMAGGDPVGPDDLEPATAFLAEVGRGITGTQFEASLAAFNGITRQVAAWWAGGWDLLLTPTIPEPPPLLGSFEVDEPGRNRAAEIVPFTIPFNLTGQPAISLPLHWTADGLPVGVQLVAAYGREDLLLRVAAQLEAAAPWADRRPPVSA